MGSWAEMMTKGMKRWIYMGGKNPNHFQYLKLKAISLQALWETGDMVVTKAGNFCWGNYEL